MKCLSLICLQVSIFCILLVIVLLWFQSLWLYLKQKIRSVELAICPMQLFSRLISDYVTFLQFKICCCVQNFMKIRWFFNDICRFNDFQNGGRPPFSNCFTTILDHQRSRCCWPQLPVKFHVNLIHRFFTWFGLKCLFRPSKWGFWGTLEP